MRRDVFQAIADPIRRDIIETLAQHPMSVNNIAAKFDISRPAISKHLRILIECQIVVAETVGRERFYSLKPQSLIPAFMWIDKYKNLWENRIDSFEQYLNTLKKEKNKDES